jgi:hypothetical protein
VTVEEAVVGAPKRVTDEIEKVGYAWKLHAQWDRQSIDPTKHIQVRDEADVAPKETVEQLAVSMAYNAIDPIVVTRDGALVNGHTRVKAAEKQNRRYLPAIVIQIDYATASTEQQAKLMLLGATLNQQQGNRLKSGAMRRNAANAIGLGLKPEEIAA